MLVAFVDESLLAESRPSVLVLPQFWNRKGRTVAQVVADLFVHWLLSWLFDALYLPLQLLHFLVVELVAALVVGLSAGVKFAWGLVAQLRLLFLGPTLFGRRLRLLEGRLEDVVVLDGGVN